MKSEEKRVRLLEIARRQGGCFTSAQAAALGFDNANQYLFVKDGRWESVRRGIFRLASEPRGEFDDLHALTLFFRHADGTPSGVFGLETAASIHGLGNFMPSRISVLVLPTFRTKATLPVTVKMIRNQDIRTQIQVIDGLPLTSSLRTIADLIQTPVHDLEETRRAFLSARQSGLISAQAVDAMHQWAAPGSVESVRNWERELSTLVDRHFA